MAVIRIIGINLGLFLRVNRTVINIRFNGTSRIVRIVLLRSLVLAPDEAVSAQSGLFESYRLNLRSVVVIVAAYESQCGQ